MSPGAPVVVRAGPTEAAQNPRSASPEAEGEGASAHLPRTVSAAGAREPSTCLASSFCEETGPVRTDARPAGDDVGFPFPKP